MLIRQKKPYLLNIEESPTEVRACCAACGKGLHVYVRSSRLAAHRRLQQSFNLHCRLRHKDRNLAAPWRDVSRQTSG